ncbi:MAG: aminoacyl-tRNA hydrolase [Actinomycetota bacterium]|nr:aminoacyl-tRNA hydrolase [Actinomycetota bacterium]
MRLWRRSAEEADAGGGSRHVVVGLGNPGPRYAETRHNAGALTLDVLLERTGGHLKSHKSGCLVAEVSLRGDRLVLARPTSYMNESGRPVGGLLRWYKQPPESLVVVHDEIDIPFGEVRIKSGGGTAGHNGLGSIVDHLGTKDFVRVRVGVGRPPGAKGAAGHVLAGFSASERKELPFLLIAAADAVEAIVAEGLERAMNEFNTRPKA